MTDEYAAKSDESPRVMTRQRGLTVCLALLISLTTSSSAQVAPPAQADPIATAFNRGQYDQIDALVGTATDARSILLRARAHIARGRYAEAEKLLAGPAASAPGSDAALELGLLLVRQGRLADGSRLLQGVLDRSAEQTAFDLMRLGQAARALGRFQEANTFFRNATRLAAGNAVIETAWGDLFLEKYDSANASQSYQAALKADASYVPALVGLARATVNENPSAARQMAEKALAINPNYVPAHLLLAELALDDRRSDDARASIKKALDVNPVTLEARSLDAAMAFLEGRPAEFESIAASVLKLHPTYGEVYRVVGDQLGRNYRFEEAVEQTRRALAIDASSVRAYADLGMHLLRTGDEPGARRALETAFKADPYDIVTYNLLALLDTIDKFETIRERDLIVKLDPGESGVMREQVIPLAQRALDTLSKQYQFTPVGPILIEMFPKHDDFAVRTIGLPGFLGALGACFGKVVTIDSPRARPPGQFNWATTLWHEMAHVITLQMSNNRLPRWLSEGISVFEERRVRDDWGREMDVSFAQALEAGKLLKLKDLNSGFSDPRTISLTYYQASLVVEHLIDTYGEPALWRLIRSYGQGVDTEEGVKQAFGASLDQIQTSFDAMLARDYADMRRALRSPEIPANPSLEDLRKLAEASPDSFRVQMELAQALHENDDPAGAIGALERAAKLIPTANGDSNPNALIALIATEQKDTARAIQALEALVKVDSSDVESARKLAALLLPTGDAARTNAAYELVAELDPFDVTAQTYVGRTALQRKDGVRAVRAFRSALAAGTADRASTHTDLAEAHLVAGQLGDAKREALAALEIAPSFERAQDVLLKVVAAPGGER